MRNRTELALILARLDKMEGRFDSLDSKIETKIDALEKRLEARIDKTTAAYVSREALEERFAAQGVRIGGIETTVTTMQQDKKWLNRTVGAAAIGAVFSVMVSLVVAFAVAL